MAKFIGFGDGHDGDGNISADPNTRTSCTGTAAAFVLTVASESGFAAGDMILVHQTRGNGAGNYEMNKVASVAAGQITTTNPLENSYSDSGDDQAQCILVPQYRSLIIDTLSVTAWAGNTGGFLAAVCSGKTTVSGDLSVAGGAGAIGTNGTAGGTGGGFRGGSAAHANPSQSNQGEGTAGAATASTSANGNGGGGAGGTGPSTGAGGGGGAHATAGGGGTAGSSRTGGSAGGTVGSSTLSTIMFGGGGGGGTNDGSEGGTPVGGGGSGGGALLIYSQDFEVTGTISANGGAGGNATNAAEGGDGGGGAGGTVYIKAVTATIGTNLITATGGTGNEKGGAGGTGRIRVEACSISGTTNPTYTGDTGGYDFCSSGARLYR